ncbi:Acetylaranotin bis-thiomethyltransferase [Penicillium capsulatum]|nr:Acetylaranotin bis-thiomethyltransferase [Penicillium capsulatum]
MATTESREGIQMLFKNNNFVTEYDVAEKVTSPFAKDLIAQSGLGANANPATPLTVLDNACGTGIVSSILHRQLDDRVKGNWTLTCGDFSEAMLERTKHRMKEEGWMNAETKVVDAQNTQLPSASYTHVITAFGYMVLPRSLDALDAGWLLIIQKAIETMPGNLPWPTPSDFTGLLNNGEWDSATWVKSQLSQRGLEGVKANVVTKKLSLTVPGFMKMATVMFPVVIQNFWTADQRDKHGEEARQFLQEYLINTYGENGDVPMTWIAILATARKPITEPGQ